MIRVASCPGSDVSAPIRTELTGLREAWAGAPRIRPELEEFRARMNLEQFDVETLRGRRADQRWNRMAVGDLLERVTWATPDKVALIGWAGAFGSLRFERMTYLEAERAANQVAHALLAEGLQSGDRVLLYCDNSVEAIVLMFGIAKAGMVAVPVNSMLAPDVLAYVLDHVDVSLSWPMPA